MSQYLFRSEWRLGAPPERVFDLLADVESYPDWWPQVRSVRRIDDESGELTCRSMLPHDITFTMHRELEDRDALVLRARVSGDLVGVGEWTITADGSGTFAVFDEQVDIGPALLRVAGRLFGPVLRRDHDHMMRSGEKGLRRYLGRA